MSEHECKGEFCVCKMSREEAVANIEKRTREIVAQVKVMPHAERLRFAADCLDQGWRLHALATLRFALTELEKES